MDEKTLIRISIIIMVLGLGFLFWYAEELDLQVVTRIDTEAPSEPITIAGTVEQLQPQGKATFIQLSGMMPVKTDIILFPEEELFLQEGDYVEVSGTVEEFNGKKEVIGSKVVLKQGKR